MQPSPLSSPVLIEVAINGARTKAASPHVPLTEDEIVRDILDCVEAGASIIHAHAGEPVVGGAGHHGSAAYLRAFARVRERHPALLMYPTLPGGGPSTAMARRLAHVVELADAGVGGIVPGGPGAGGGGRGGARGRPPGRERGYQ